jgi:hypothetical protein
VQTRIYQDGKTGARKFYRVSVEQK